MEEGEKCIKTCPYNLMGNCKYDKAPECYLETYQNEKEL